MASSSNQSQESRTQIPSEIMSGDSARVSSANFKNQKQSGPSVPLSPQLRYSLSRVSPPSSRSFSPATQTVASIANGSLRRVSSPSPETVASIAKGSYYKVSSERCPENRVLCGLLYLSRNSLLKKMSRQSGFFIRSKIEPEIEEQDRLALRIRRFLEDCWETYPIQPPIRLENAVLPTFESGDEESSSIAYVNPPVKSTRHSLKLLEHQPFLWVTNPTGTKFLDRWSYSSRRIFYIRGFGECPICSQIWIIDQCVPRRFDLHDILLVQLAEIIDQLGVVPTFLVGCRCDGNLNPLRPIISDDPNKINWLFLFLGFGIGYCTIDQLKYYCIQRRLPISDDKKMIVRSVFDDLYQQIYLHRFGA